MTYGLAIVAHPARRDNVDRLSRLLKPDAILMDYADAPVGCAQNHLSALLSLRQRMGQHTWDWVVILEDDAVPMVGFHAELDKALELAPAPIVSLYNGTGYPTQYQREFAQAAQSDASWIMHSHLRHAVGYVVHRVILWDLIDGITGHIREQWAPDDAISKWACQKRIPVAYTNPSLVNHADGPTVIENRTFRGRRTPSARHRPRRAHNFTPPPAWTDKSVTI